MNADQKLIASMVVILIGLVAWTTYKPWIKAVLFTPPAQGQGSGSNPPWIGTLIDPFGVGKALGLPVSENAATGQASAGTPLTSVPGASTIPGQMLA